MLIKKLRGNSTKQKENHLDIIPEKNKSNIKEKNNDMLLHKINYNTYDKGSPHKLEYVKKNIFPERNKNFDSLNMRNNERNLIQPLKTNLCDMVPLSNRSLIINKFNYNSNKNLAKIPNTEKITNKSKNPRSKSPLRAKLIIKRPKNKTDDFPTIPNNNLLSLSIHKIVDNLGVSKDKIQNNCEISKSNFFSFYNIQKEKEEKYERLKSIKQSYREKKLHNFNKNEKVYYVKFN